MHYKHIYTVKFKEKLIVEGQEGKVEGCAVIFGVNAKDISSGVHYTEKALHLKLEDHVDNIDIVEVSIEKISSEYWSEGERSIITDIDNEGVYYRSGICFYLEDRPCWWKFWQKKKYV